MEIKKFKKIKGIFARERVISDQNKEAREVYDQSRFGEPVGEKYQYSLVEAMYLLEKKKIDIYDHQKKKLKTDDFLKRARKIEPKFWIRYCVYKDMRQRGYIVKSALKFGADFMVYDRGVKPGEDHAKWILYPVHEGETLTWYDYAAKNRVAHSTRKRLLIAIVDDRGDSTYYQCVWTRP